MRYKKIAAFVTAAALLLSGCSGLSEKRNLTYTDTLYDTVISVQILDPASEEILEGCEKLCKKYDTMFSMTNEESEIYKINHAGGAAVEVSQDTITLIKKGIYYSEMTNGAFDIYHRRRISALGFQIRRTFRSLRRDSCFRQKPRKLQKYYSERQHSETAGSPGCH